MLPADFILLTHSIDYPKFLMQKHMILPVVGPALSFLWSLPQGTLSPGYLPESVARTAVFDPTPCMGLAVGCPQRYPGVAGFQW
jgi:hypothetical protein